MTGLHGALVQEISGIVLHVTLAQEIPVPSVYPLASSRIPILTIIKEKSKREI